MKRLITTTATAVVLMGALVLPQASAAPIQHTPTAAECNSKWKVTGRKVAVRRPVEGPVAQPNSPVDHHLRRGDVVTSCVVAIARTESGPAYHKCGKDGHEWRVVKGGQIPQTCLKRA